MLFDCLPRVRNLQETKKEQIGASLSVYWLELGTFIAQGMGLILGWETKIPQAMQHHQKKKKNFKEEGKEENKIKK